jgi:hypothetical protein
MPLLQEIQSAFRNLAGEARALFGRGREVAKLEGIRFWKGDRGLGEFINHQNNLARDLNVGIGENLKELLARPNRLKSLKPIEPKLLRLVADIEEIAANNRIPCPEMNLVTVRSSVNSPMFADYNRIHIHLPDIHNLSSEQLRAIAEHEIGHIVGGDVLNGHLTFRRSARHAMEYRADDKANPGVLARAFRERRQQLLADAEGDPEKLQALQWQLKYGRDVDPGLDRRIARLEKRAQQIEQGSHTKRLIDEVSAKGPREKG